jgi:hypothetical protein
MVDPNDFGDSQRGAMFYIPPPDDGPTPTREKWEPSFIDIFAIALGIAAVIMWFHPPDWQFGVPIAAFIVGAILFTAYRHRSPFLLRWLMAIVITGFFIWAIWPPLWDSFHKDYPTISFQSPITFESRQQVPPQQPTQTGSQPTRFYSQKDKEHLADLCADLIGFLRNNGGDGGGNGLWKRIATLGNDWQLLGNNPPPDPKLFDQEMAQAHDSIDVFQDGLYGDGGTFKKYDAYHDELQDFFPPNYIEQIRGLRSELDEFGNSIAVLEAEKDTTVRQRLFAALKPSHEKYEQMIIQFQKHLFETTQRVEAFKKQL